MCSIVNRADIFRVTRERETLKQQINNMQNSHAGSCDGAAWLFFLQFDSAGCFGGFIHQGSQNRDFLQ
jgi:hypothetical protein